MKIESIPIADLHLDPGNFRKHPGRSIASIKASLVLYKQQRPILIDSKNVVRAGNGTLQAAIELGWRLIDCVRSDLSPSELVTYSVADNWTAKLGEDDTDAVGQLLQTLRAEEEDYDFTSMGISDDEFAKMIGGLTSNPDDEPTSSAEPIPPNDFNAYDEAIETEYQCPKCSYSWSGKPK